MFILIIIAAVALAAGTYLGLERLGRRGLVPMVCRTVAWSALGILVANMSCPVAGRDGRPLVLLDGSLSVRADSARFMALADSASRLGEVRTFGDERPSTDSLVERGRTLLRPALVPAVATGRPVVVFTDGEVEDAADLPPDVVQRASIRVMARPPNPDVAIGAIAGPARITAGDSLRVRAEVVAGGGRVPDSATIRLVHGSRELDTRRVSLAGGSAEVNLVATSKGMQAGPTVLRVELVHADDAEPRDDARRHVVDVTAAPGVVLLAGPADWDSRFLYRTLGDVAQLPVRGYVRLQGDQWRSMENLATVPAGEVARAARGADLLVLKGAVGEYGSRSGARGVLRWASGENGAATLPGDWYAAPGPGSPVGAALAGLPVDSFPPLLQVTPIEPATGDWVGLVAQAGRRGAARPVIVGRPGERRREVTVAADGLWRWAFRGGSSEQAYRSLVAATATWLLGGRDSTRGMARPVREVVDRARPVVFQWNGPGAPEPLAVTFVDSARTVRDSLRFDGAGLARAWLPVGTWQYRVAEGGNGMVVVDTWSAEWLPRPVTLEERTAVRQAALVTSPARGWLWLFALAIIALAGEWLARRRLGLR